VTTSRVDYRAARSIAASRPCAPVRAAELAHTSRRELAKGHVSSGKVTEACAAFEASQKLEPAVTTLMNLGGCREQNGQYATAWGIFVDVQRNLRDMTDDDSQQIVKVAQPRLSKLTVKSRRSVRSPSSRSCATTSRWRPAPGTRRCRSTAGPTRSSRAPRATRAGRRPWLSHRRTTPSPSTSPCWSRSCRRRSS
jgi:hypothetical protein